jgi:hypothetical protein
MDTLVDVCEELFSSTTRLEHKAACDLFPLIANLLQDCVSQASDTVIVESGFSLHTYLDSKHRNRTTEELMDDLMYGNLNLPHLASVDGERILDRCRTTFLEAKHRRLFNENYNSNPDKTPVRLHKPRRSAKRVSTANSFYGLEEGSLHPLQVGQDFKDSVRVGREEAEAVMQKRKEVKEKIKAAARKGLLEDGSYHAGGWGRGWALVPDTVDLDPKSAQQPNLLGKRKTQASRRMLESIADQPAPARKRRKRKATGSKKPAGRR